MFGEHLAAAKKQRRLAITRGASYHRPKLTRVVLPGPAAIVSALLTGEPSIASWAGARRRSMQLSGETLGWEDARGRSAAIHAISSGTRSRPRAERPGPDGTHGGLRPSQTAGRLAPGSLSLLEPLCAARRFLRPRPLGELSRDNKLAAKLRRRLSSISWFIAILRENIAQPDHWLDTPADYASALGHAVGRADSSAAVRERMDVQHLKGITACRRALT